MRVIAKHVGLLVSTLVAVSAAGCGGGSADVTPVPLIQTVARLSVSPTALDMVVGASATLSARTYDASGAELTGRLLTWSSSDISKLTVSTSGLVTAVATGTFTVTASAEGKSASASVTCACIALSPANARFCPERCSTSLKRASTCPAFTKSFTSTKTSATRPEVCADTVV